MRVGRHWWTRRRRISRVGLPRKSRPLKWPSYGRLSATSAISRRLCAWRAAFGECALRAAASRGRCCSNRRALDELALRILAGTGERRSCCARRNQHDHHKLLHCALPVDHQFSLGNDGQKEATIASRADMSAPDDQRLMLLLLIQRRTSSATGAASVRSLDC